MNLIARRLATSWTSGARRPPSPLNRYQTLPVVAVILILGLVVRSGWSAPEQSEVKKLPLPVLNEKLKHELLGYLRQNHKSPEDYVLAKLKDHQIVFLGEYHRIKHDVELVQRLIPRLYDAGIYHLGIEFGVYRDQSRVDKLINAPDYDEQAARDILFNWGVWWGYQEYLDIYRAAWELNHKLPRAAPRFRVVNLNAFADWSFVHTTADRNNAKVMKKVWPEGESDPFMASVIFKQFVEKGQKALIYSGIHHAFTRYKQPIVERGRFVRFGDVRMGNLVSEKLGTDRVFTICLHQPWRDANDQKEIYPAEGVIDALLFNETDLRPVGFDLVGTPFGALGGKGSAYEKGHEPFRLELYADGYIYTKPISQYHGVTTDEKFITATNLEQSITQFPNPEGKAKLADLKMKTPIDQLTKLLLEEGIKHDANIPQRFARFW